MSFPEISKVLTLSTVHIPYSETTVNHDEVPEWAFSEFPEGYLVCVSGFQYRFPLWLRRICLYAQKHGCMYILFDADADAIDELENYSGTWQ